MPAHDTEHQETTTHEAGATEHHPEVLETEGAEPARIAATAPSGGATKKDVKAVDSHGRDLGNFLLTHYTFALESDPIHAGSPKVSAPGLPKDRKYKQSFLGSPYGIKMQGTGLAEDGSYIRYQGSNSYSYGVGGAAGAPVAWKTVAVDPSVIKLGSHLDIEEYRGKGTFEAKDTGGAIKGKHIDVFAGAVPIKQAYALGTKHSEVFLVNGSAGGGDQHTDQHPAGQQTAANPATAAHPAAQHSASQGYKPAPSLAEARAGSAVIKKGMEGPSVKFVQEKVHAAADGEFGPNTDAAVKKFQHAHHLEVDGEVGAHTMAALDGHSKPAPKPAGGGSHEQAPPVAGGGQTAPAGGEAAVRDEVIAKAKSHSGAPYSWGAQGPSMFDCSGFSWYVLHSDMHLTDKGRTTAEGLSGAAYTTPTSSPQKGDLVFYSSGHISHVTIALGSGTETIGASGGGPNTHGQDPKAKVKITDWTHDTKRSKTFGSIDKLIAQRLAGKK
jgi:3D (Asp-Asp-Asp) domain-containing protein